MTKVWRRVVSLLRLRRIDAELREEMEVHRSLSGTKAFGNPPLAHEDARAVWLAPWLESVWQDARHGVRVLRRDRAFTIVAAAALGVAVGLNTSLFATF